MLDHSVKYECACQDGEQLAIFHLQIDCMECVFNKLFLQLNVLSFDAN